MSSEMASSVRTAEWVMNTDDFTLDADDKPSEAVPESAIEDAIDTASKYASVKATSDISRVIVGGVSEAANQPLPASDSASTVESYGCADSVSTVETHGHLKSASVPRILTASRPMTHRPTTTPESRQALVQSVVEQNGFTTRTECDDEGRWLEAVALAPGYTNVGNKRPGRRGTPAKAGPGLLQQILDTVWSFIPKWTRQGTGHGVEGQVGVENEDAGRDRSVRRIRSEPSPQELRVVRDIFGHHWEN